MVVDTSALVAVLKAEPEASRIDAVLSRGDQVAMSAATWVEASIVIGSRWHPDDVHDLDQLISRSRIEIIPVSEGHAELARTAYMRFGKGRHPAGLNFGDCFSYALARALGQPLLFVGRDFSKTDIDVAAY